MAGATITGGAYGNSTIQLTSQDNGDLIRALGWNNTIHAEGVNVTIEGGQGQASVFVGDGSSEIDLAGWNNLVAGSSMPLTGAGADGNLTISGSQGSTTVLLGNGANRLSLGGYNNLITVGNGADTITAGSGSETVSTGNGSSWILLGGWSNQVVVGDGANTITGSSGSTTVTGGNGANRVELQGFSNRISLGAGSNTVVAGAGSDSVSVGAGHNAITLSGWGNQVTATGGADTVFAGSGTDTLHISGTQLTVAGGAGALVLVDGTAPDSVTDHSSGLVIEANAHSPSTQLFNLPSDSSWVFDLIGGAGHYGSVAQVLGALQTQGSNTVLSLGGSGATITFVDTTKAMLTAAHFRIN